MRRDNLRHGASHDPGFLADTAGAAGRWPCRYPDCGAALLAHQRPVCVGHAKGAARTLRRQGRADRQGNPLVADFGGDLRRAGRDRAVGLAQVRVD